MITCAILSHYFFSINKSGYGIAFAVLSGVSFVIGFAKLVVAVVKEL